ncbi:hypothetical protein [Streptomyces sp. NPDC006739]
MPRRALVAEEFRRIDRVGTPLFRRAQPLSRRTGRRHGEGLGRPF